MRLTRALQLPSVGEIMKGGRFSNPVRRCSVVERARSDHNVHALLRQFERVGFTLAPRLLDPGKDGSREVLSFVEGESALYPLPAEHRTDMVLINVANAVRSMHDATQGFQAPDPHGWQAKDVASPVHIDCIGHHDLGPWNIILDGSRVSGIIRDGNPAFDVHRTERHADAYREDVQFILANSDTLLSAR